MEGSDIVVISALEGPLAGTPKRTPVRQLEQFDPAKKDYLAKDAARKAAVRLLKRAAEVDYAAGKIESLPTPKRAGRPTKADVDCTVKHVVKRARKAAAAAAATAYLTMVGGLVSMDCEEIRAQAEEMAARIVASALAAEEEAAKAAKAAELVAAERVAEKAAAAWAAWKAADACAKAERVAAAERKAAAEWKAAEKTAAQLQKLEKLLANKLVEQPPLIPRLTVVSEEVCPICLENEAEDSNPPDSSMPCCQGHIHISCLISWRAQAIQKPSAWLRGPTQSNGSSIPIV